MGWGLGALGCVLRTLVAGGRAVPIHGVTCGEETHKAAKHEECALCPSPILLWASWVNFQGHVCVFKAKTALQLLTDHKPTGCLINQAQKSLERRVYQPAWGYGYARSWSSFPLPINQLYPSLHVCPLLCSFVREALKGLMVVSEINQKLHCNCCGAVFSTAASKARYNQH